MPVTTKRTELSLLSGHPIQYLYSHVIRKISIETN